MIKNQNNQQVKKQEVFIPTKDLTRVLRLLHKRTGINFLEYKLPLINRRIQRRIALRKIPNLDIYYSLLQKDSQEVDALQTDLLITVTHFFRDPEKFTALQKIVFPIITEKKSERKSVRMWVPGCATGEEAYSLAIVFSEFLEKNHLQLPFQIFATDISSSSIEKARLALYPDTIAEHVSSERLERYFIKVPGGYQINKSLQDHCLFVVHNIAENPPFSNLDVISCLNVLIYMDIKLRQKILSLFHFALNDPGFLMVGNSENMGIGETYFSVRDAKHKIFSKNVIPLAIDKGQKKRKKKKKSPITESEKKAVSILTRTKRIAKLREALFQTQQHADSLINELDNMTEELQFANEELLANNAELQTANEELETSEEELQAANEELQALNQELKKREEAKARLAAIVESSEDAILSKDLDGTITSWNGGAERLYGYTAEEIIGKSITILIPPKKRRDFLLIMKMIKRGKQVKHYETQRITKEQNIIDVSITVSPIKNGQGKVIGASAIAREITQRKQMEKENEMLYRDTQRAIKLRDTFISIASHELKTPLTSLKMYTQMLQQDFEQRGETEISESLKKMDHQIDSLTELVRDLLDVSRLEHGKLTMQQKVFNLNALVKETIENIQQTTKKYTIVLQGSVTKNVKGDRFRINQVLVNLLTNAIKYSPNADKIIVTVKEQDNKAVVQVQDFGLGIRKKHRDDIFKRFYRVNDLPEMTYPGLGMGLYISSEIIKRHGGVIQVRSSKGKGSIFSFTLPLHE